MPLVKYRIYELSARAVISYGRQQDGTYTFHLSAAETEKCKSLSAPHEQDDNALFYQIMCVLHGDAFTGRPGGQLVTETSRTSFSIWTSPASSTGAVPERNTGSGRKKRRPCSVPRA